MPVDPQVRVPVDQDPPPGPDLEIRTLQSTIQVLVGALARHVEHGRVMDTELASLDDVIQRRAAAWRGMREHLQSLGLDDGAQDRVLSMVRAQVPDVEECEQRWQELQRERDLFCQTGARFRGCVEAMDALRWHGDGVNVPQLVCPICYARPVAEALVPCGHTLCTACARQILRYDSICGLCRQHVTHRIRVYLPGPDRLEPAPPGQNQTRGPVQDPGLDSTARSDSGPGPGPDATPRPDETRLMWAMQVGPARGSTPAPSETVAGRGTGGSPPAGASPEAPERVQRSVLRRMRQLAQLASLTDGLRILRWTDASTRTIPNPDIGAD